MKNFLKTLGVIVVVAGCSETGLGPDQASQEARALPTLGFEEVTAVRQGKHFELEVRGDDPEGVARQVAETLLANPVIEDFTVTVNK